MVNAPLGTVLRQLRGMVHPKAYEDASDRQLLERFLIQHEEEAFVALLRRHGPMVLHVCRRVQGNEHDAEDAFQATFLVLARKAGSIRKQESVASWLYGVAQRVALEARGQGFRRHARERRAADMRKTSDVSHKAWQELEATLDEALGQVPEKYRAPLLLCYLQGKTQDEAARQLGCPLGTVRSRLARGRERLKQVLHQRGICLSATALAVGLVGSAASACVPSPLLQSTARAALLYAAGMAPAAVVSARTATLLEAALRAMGTMKLRIATAIVLAVGSLGLGAAVLATHLPGSPGQEAAEINQGSLAGPNAQAGEKAAAQAEIKQPGAPAQSPAAKESTDVSVQGRVLDSAGKPIAGANLLLFGKTEGPVDLGTSAADGRFTVRVPKDAPDDYLVARMDGSGLDFFKLSERKPGGPVEMRMVKDGVICGRVVDTEGKPVAGVRVAVSSLNVYANDSLESFLAEWKRRHFQSGVPAGVKHLWREAGSFLMVTTDVEGRFVLHGAGAERLVALRLSGAGIADARVWVANRRGFDPKPYNQATHDNIPKGFEHFAPAWILSGPDLSVVAEAEKPIRGVVTEADTGKGRPGVDVWLTRNGDDLVPVMLRTKTDRHGRYEIHGARKGKAYMLEVVSDPATGYMGCQAQAADTPGYQPITADIRMVKGVIITGKVIDKTTGRAVPGFALAGILVNNPFVKDYPELNSSAWIRTENTSAPEGIFRIVTIPGPVLFMGGPDYRRLPAGTGEHFKYKPPMPDPRYPQYFYQPTGTAYYTIGGAITPIQGTFCKVLQIKPGTAILHEDVVLEQASALPVKIKDAAGRPITGAWVTGISPQDWHGPTRIEKDSCLAYHVEASKPRLMVFYEASKKLIGTLTLKGDEIGPVVARLGAAGSVKGRLVGEDGKPLAGFVIEAYYRQREAQEVFEYLDRARPRIVTDANGSFRIDELIPGVEFKLDHHRAGRRVPGLKVLAEKLRVRPGVVLDLGDLHAKPAPQKSEQ